MIEPLTPLPTITESVEIYGYTQTGATRNTALRGTNARLKVVVSGVNLTTGFAVGLTISAPDSLVEGLVINRFQGAQIQLQAGAASTWIRGTFLGVNAAGTSAAVNPSGGRGRDRDSERREPDRRPARGHRNLISGNGGNGIGLGPGSSTTVVRGNLIGTGRGGNDDIGNGFSGVQIVDSTDNTIGGLTQGAGTSSRGTASRASTSRTSAPTATTSSATTSASARTDERPCRTSDYGVLVVFGSSNVIGSTAPAAGTSSRATAARGPLRGHLERAARQLHRYRQHGNPGRRERRRGRVRDRERPTASAGRPRLTGTSSPETAATESAVVHRRARGDRRAGELHRHERGWHTRPANDGDGVEPEQGSNLKIGGAVSAPGRAPGNVISGNRENGIRVPTGRRRPTSTGTSSARMRAERPPFPTG